MASAEESLAALSLWRRVAVIPRIIAPDPRGGFSEGSRHRLEVLAGGTRIETGSGGFDRFAGESHTVRNVAPSAAPKQCFECHRKVEARGYVFSHAQD